MKRLEIAALFADAGQICTAAGNGLRMGKNNTGFERHSDLSNATTAVALKISKLSLKQVCFKTIKKW